MPGIRFKVGASLDANAASVFQPLVKASEKARAQIQKNLGVAAKSLGDVPRAAKRSGDALERELEKEADKILATERKAQQGRVKEVERAARERIRLEKAAMRELERELERERKSNANRDRGGGAIGFGYRAAIRVPKPVAIGYGMFGGGVRSAFHMAEGLFEGMGVETSLAPHMAHAVEMRRQAQDVVNAGYIPGSAGQAGILQDPKALIEEVQAVANRTAFSGNEAMDALRQFVAKTGDLQGGRDVLLDMAKLSRATGTNLVEMAESAAEVSNHLGDMPDKAGAVAQVMRIIAGQGKLGAVEIKDLARQMAKIAATAPSYEGGTVKVIGELGLLAQESKLRGGSTSAAQAATSVARFAQDFSKGTTIKHWTAAGLNPYTDSKHTTLRTPEEIILEALNYSKGDLMKLAQLFPNAMSMRAVRGFATVYQEAGGTNEDKLKAVADEFDRLRHAQLSAEEVQRAFSNAMGTAQSKVQLANNRLDEMAGKIQEALLPALAELAPAIEALTPAMVGIVKKVASLLGIDVDADEEARRKRRQQDLIQAAASELSTAESTPAQLVRGAHGAELKLGTFDRAHYEAIAKQSGDIGEQAAKEQGELDQLKERARKQMEEAGKNRLGLKAVMDPAVQAEIDKRQAHINELKAEQSRTNDILAEIRDALQQGKIQLSPPPTKPNADKGTASADAAVEHE